MKQKKEFEIRNGMKGAVVNQCTVNAINNALRLMKPDYLKKYVKDENPNFVQVQAGSLGFRSDDGRKLTGSSVVAIGTEWKILR